MNVSGWIIGYQLFVAKWLAVLGTVLLFARRAHVYKVTTRNGTYRVADDVDTGAARSVSISRFPENHQRLDPTTGVVPLAICL